MNWKKLQAEGRVRTHKTGKKELNELRALIARDLEDAAIQELSDDRRFATSYNAALQTAKMGIACAGYQLASRALPVCVILSQDARGSVDYNSSFAEYGQKFSICHTFLVPLPSAMANDRPSGDGIAYRM
jgi:hypothetical protein